MKYLFSLFIILFIWWPITAQIICNENINSGGIYNEQNGIQHTGMIGSSIVGEGFSPDGSFSICNGFIGCSRDLM